MERKKIKYVNFPRKLKKRIKKALRKSIDAVWKDSEIKIERVVVDSFSTINGKPDFNRFFITDYKLG